MERGKADTAAQMAEPTKTGKGACDKDTDDAIAYARNKIQEANREETMEKSSEDEAIGRSHREKAKALRKEAVSSLLVVEKKARLGDDKENVKRCVTVILKIFEESKDYDNLNDSCISLCGKRGQWEDVVGEIVKIVTGMLESVKDKEDKEKLIGTLRSVSKGKISLEFPRAYLTRTLAQMKESAGDKEAACVLLLEETPESYINMEFINKLDYLLEQFRLCLETKNYVRAHMVGQKIDRTKLSQFRERALMFYQLYLDYYAHEGNSLELARCHLAIYNDPSCQEDETKWPEEMKRAIVYLCATPYCTEQMDLTHRLINDPKAQQLTEYYSLLKRFVTDEIAQWPLPENNAINLTLQKIKSNLASAEENELNKWLNSLQKLLRDRVIEHDIRVVSKYYTRLYIDDLAKKLGIASDETEDYVSRLVTTSTGEKFYARIDRPDGIISFQKNETPDDCLTDWTEKIETLLHQVENTCHLIHKEYMMHRI